ncbi:cytochrome c and c1 heme-lyase [Pseudovirgaria hyperparasitica]|uniref:Holocytochrome c-type synthase n=1 Tax=Pseudovirgaria hyperparasitica TaxID=470096 RepID=A0A6A6WE95_9PEZI|nr:cytochrome c and c1 heme-lyase [Pseudovirgaria hyperparasitica]KAF2759441.1 cytochrome c and c1 heme-lyase [Pseudovirgaria hyperparasitica]
MGNGQSTPEAKPSVATSTSADVCPVDHKSREAWLEKARMAEASKHHTTPTPTSTPSPLGAPSTCDSSNLASDTPKPQSTTSKILSSVGLSTHREVSTIPRAPPGVAPAAPKNSEQQQQQEQHTTPDSEPADAHKKETNWIYPSPKMFYEAMKRKKHSPEPATMDAIVPIHNAVNERVWTEIKTWEHGWGTDACEGPFGGTFLESFHGMGDQLSPKARVNSWLGYAKPFDRHEWVINRCGRRVEYLIDFYAGRDEGVPGKSLNFYLDVRPKLNSWEGWAMRGARVLGLRFEKEKGATGNKYASNK